MFRIITTILIIVICRTSAQDCTSPRNIEKVNENLALILEHKGIVNIPPDNFTGKSREFVQKACLNGGLRGRLQMIDDMVRPCPELVTATDLASELRTELTETWFTTFDSLTELCNCYEAWSYREVLNMSTASLRMNIPGGQYPSIINRDAVCETNRWGYEYRTNGTLQW